MSNKGNEDVDERNKRPQKAGNSQVSRCQHETGEEWFRLRGACVEKSVLASTIIGMPVKLTNRATLS